MANEAARKETALAPIDSIRQTIATLAPEFKAALPPQIPVERFIRTIITTVQMNPDLLTADRKSLLSTCMKAAQDGLLLDGREAAAVIFKGKCQYMPMVSGILKKMRNSGDIASVDAQTVYTNDYFLYELGLEPKLVHRPIITGERGPSICWYAVVKTKDGGIIIEVMNKADIEKVRKVSKAKSEDSPWNTWYEEMAEKTILKRISKRCPSSADLEQVIEHDNEVIGFPQKGRDPETSQTKEVDARPSYLKMLAESEQGGEQAEESTTDASRVEGATMTTGDAAPPKVEVEAQEAGHAPEKPQPIDQTNTKGSDMEETAKAAMDKAVGNRQLDAAWTKHIPSNLRMSDPEAYKRLSDYYKMRLDTFKAK